MDAFSSWCIQKMQNGYFKHLHLRPPALEFLWRYNLCFYTFLFWTLFDTDYVLLLNNDWHLLDLCRAVFALSLGAARLVFVKILWFFLTVRNAGVSQQIHSVSGSTDTAMIQNSACLRLLLSERLQLHGKGWVKWPCYSFHFPMNAQTMPCVLLVIQTAWNDMDTNTGPVDSSEGNTGRWY